MITVHGDFISYIINFLPFCSYLGKKGTELISKIVPQVAGTLTNTSIIFLFVGIHNCACLGLILFFTEAHLIFYFPQWRCQMGPSWRIHFG